MPHCFKANATCTSGCEVLPPRSRQFSLNTYTHSHAKQPEYVQACTCARTVGEAADEPGVPALVWRVRQRVEGAQTYQRVQHPRQVPAVQASSRRREAGAGAGSTSGTGWHLAAT